MDRTKLPYRTNCEGYFIVGNNGVIARDTGQGYIEFPGGGIDGDDPKDAVAREALEETGAVVANLRKVAVIHCDWSPGWAKTEKQRSRYKQFRGEEMHLFVGAVKSLNEPLGDPETGDTGWPEPRMMKISTVVHLIESFRPFPPGMEEYHQAQIDNLKRLEDLFSEDS